MQRHVLNCIFCAIVGRAERAEIVYENENAVAFLDAAQVTEGHTLVVPREHCVDLFDIGAQRGAEVMRAAVTVATLLRERFEPSGMNLVHASGATAWQSVFHFHLHLIPRYDVTELTPPWPPGHAFVDPEVLARTAARMRG